MKTAVFIPVRSNSSRLPQKCYLEILGKPTIEYLIDRAKFSNVGPVVICTTNEKEDDKFVEIAKKNRVEIFRGSTEDVLGRFLSAAIKYNVDYIIDADGDDILCEPLYMKKIKDLFLQKDYDYIAIEKLPLGLYPSGMSTRSLKIISKIKNEDSTDGWRRYYTETNIFKCHLIQAPIEHQCNELRLTLDYKEDYDLISTIINTLNLNNDLFNIDDIFKLIRKKPQLLKINDSVKALFWQNHNSKYLNVKLKPNYLEIINKMAVQEGWQY